MALCAYLSDAANAAADVIGNAVHVLTGEVEEVIDTVLCTMTESHGLARLPGS